MFIGSIPRENFAWAGEMGMLTKRGKYGLKALVYLAHLPERQLALVDILKSDPAIDYINSTVGAGGPNTTANYGRLFVALKPKKQRDSLNVIIGRLRAKARQVPGLQAFFQPIQTDIIGANTIKRR